MKEKKHPIHFLVLAILFFASTLEIPADIMSEHYSIIKKKRYKKRHYRKKRKRRKSKDVVLADPKKWQTALTYLGYYYGDINGNMNSFDTHNAINQFQKVHKVPITGLADQQLKDYLFYIYNISQISKYLNYEGDNKISKGKKYQAALKVHNVYYNEIDGIIGSDTKQSILTYKHKMGLYTQKTTLSDKEKKELIISAKILLKEQQTDFKPKKDTNLVQTENNETTEPISSSDISEYNSSIPDDIANIAQEIVQSTKEVTAQ